MTEPKCIYNKYFPPFNNKLMSVWKWILIREEYREHLLPRDFNHEKIHLIQQGEMTVVGFLTLYIAEYVVKLIITFNHHRAYRSISTEQEAYANEGKQSYLFTRKKYAWRKYIFKLIKK